MLSINTNLSSLIAQNSLKDSTDILNLAVERMTTGYKINHAKDNAANYSISTNMTTKINSYMVAEENCAMGLDLVNTASDTITLMQDKAERLRALCIQARNGTYGAQSLNAIQTEANSIIDEINRIYNTAEYNEISLFNRTEFDTPDYLPVANDEYNGFISEPKTYTDTEVAAMIPLSEDITTVLNGQKYSISTGDELANLAELVNSGIDTTGVEFVLGADIDLSSFGSWTPIGDLRNNNSIFRGSFNGNGHIIKNLTTNTVTSPSGLFGCAQSTATIKNLGLVNVNIVAQGTYAGGLIGRADKYTIENCFVTGNISNTALYTGGICGYLGISNITDSYFEGKVYSSSQFSGGFVGHDSNSYYMNCYADANVYGNNYVGGFLGAVHRTISNINIQNCYSKGDVSGNFMVGGLFGRIEMTTGEIEIKDSASLAYVSGPNGVTIGDFTGALCNSEDGINFSNIIINNCLIINNDNNVIGQVYKYPNGSSAWEVVSDFDKTSLVDGINEFLTRQVGTNLQVGIAATPSCSLSFNTNFSCSLAGICQDITSVEALNSIENFVLQLSEKSTELGAVENRLQSALESIEVNIENLTSSRSTIRDADIAEVSSHYIQQQILQQASATLLATANQAPAIALQLI